MYIYLYMFMYKNPTPHTRFDRHGSYSTKEAVEGPGPGSYKNPTPTAPRSPAKAFSGGRNTPASGC